MTSARSMILGCAVVFLFALQATPARAQVGAEVGPDTWGYAEGPPKREPRASMTPLALATSLAFDATTWAALQISTMPVVTTSQEMYRLEQRGYYELELFQLILLARRSDSPLPKLIAQREKGSSLREIAQGLKLDYDSIYDQSLALEDRVDNQIVPRIMTVSVSTAPTPSSIPSAKPANGKIKK